MKVGRGYATNINSYKYYLTPLLVQCTNSLKTSLLNLIKELSMNIIYLKTSDKKKSYHLFDLSFCLLIDVSKVSNGTRVMY